MITRHRAELRLKTAHRVLKSFIMLS